MREGNYSIVIARLKQLRNANNLSQEEVAKYLHCTQVAYGMYELDKRKISVDRLIVLAKYYHVSLDYLAGFSDQIQVSYGAKVPDNPLE